jgi:hypothetical protein
MGQPLPFAPEFTDLELWSEVAGIPSVPRVDRCNGSSVPMNETADAVACGKDPSARSVEQGIGAVKGM